MTLVKEISRHERVKKNDKHIMLTCKKWNTHCNQCLTLSFQAKGPKRYLDKKYVVKNRISGYYLYYLEPLA